MLTGLRGVGRALSPNEDGSAVPYCTVKFSHICLCFIFCAVVVDYGNLLEHTHFHCVRTTTVCEISSFPKKNIA